MMGDAEETSMGWYSMFLMTSVVGNGVEVMIDMATENPGGDVQNLRDIPVTQIVTEDVHESV